MSAPAFTCVAALLAAVIRLRRPRLGFSAGLSEPAEPASSVYGFSERVFFTIAGALLVRIVAAPRRVLSCATPLEAPQILWFCALSRRGADVAVRDPALRNWLSVTC